MDLHTGRRAPSSAAASPQNPRRSRTTCIWTTTGRPVARPSATSPRSPRPASARVDAFVVRAAPAAAAPAPTLLRTPRTRRRIWSSRRDRRGRGGRLVPRLSAGATRTSPRSPCGGPAPRSTSRTSARAATGAPCRRSASTRRRGRRRITTVNYTHVIRTSRGDGVWSRRETPHFRLPLDARAKRSAQGVVLQSDTTRRRHCIAV
jgi:hypothetical protein